MPMARGAGVPARLSCSGMYLPLQFLHRVPVELKLFGDVLDARLPAAPAHVPGKAPGVEGVVGKPVEAPALHAPAAPAMNTAHLEFEINARVGARQIAHEPAPAVVPARLRPATAATERFFDRRTRVMTRALGSPNRPCTVARARKPGKAYASRRRLGLGLAGSGESCQGSRASRTLARPCFPGLNRSFA